MLYSSLFFFYMIPPPRRSTLFPYTTLFRSVVMAAQQFKSDFVAVVSGFRHPKYNLMLRKKGRQVARDSQHTHGNAVDLDRKSTRLNSSHGYISYAVFCLKKKTNINHTLYPE